MAEFDAGEFDDGNEEEFDVGNEEEFDVGEEDIVGIPGNVVYDDDDDDDNDDDGGRYYRCILQVEEEAIECTTKTGILACLVVQKICRLIIENREYFKCSYIAQAFLNTRKSGFTHGELYERRFMDGRSEVIGVNQMVFPIIQITLLSLIEQFFGANYMYDCYDMTQSHDYFVFDYDDDDSTRVPDDHEQIEEVESDDELPMPAFV
jgi:hypothetical protein